MFGFQSFGASTRSVCASTTTSDKTTQPITSLSSAFLRSALTRRRISLSDLTPLAEPNVSQATESGIFVQYEKNPKPPMRFEPRTLKIYGVPGNCAARVGRGCQKIDFGGASFRKCLEPIGIGYRKDRVHCRPFNLAVPTRSAIPRIMPRRSTGQPRLFVKTPSPRSTQERALPYQRATPRACR